MLDGVDRYTERLPDPAARGLLACVWSRRIASPAARVARIVPDACVDVIWYRATGELFVAGPDTRSHLAELVPGEVVGARFRTGRSPAGLGVPADALRDERVDLGELWEPGRARRLADALADTESIGDAQGVLTRAVLAGTRDGQDTAVPTMLRLARAGDRVGAMADTIGLTERQLHRRCLAAFGYGPKVLQRVLRFDAARRLAGKGTAFADVAHRTGYADQAHLAREVRALAGVSLTELIS
ncbi:helix-turn-helix domain-containing protein [Actinophytocola gossypii]|uniref:Helix-turn-helix domain-containing protein n=1 Tax=Actinophytocola gossypii TaxID=2812003 RepID=A0ABT2J7E2_9PSEU|nr:helix-turn-helix domain-containing protein [Actinophytocola gossypii]MCT2583194.1 helix-turn-helix domain-containing protein [Actinophytocola gossypii]